MDYNDASTNFGDIGGDVIGADVSGNNNTFVKVEKVEQLVLIVPQSSRGIESDVHDLVNSFSQGNHEKAVESLTKITQDPNIQRQVKERIEQGNISPNTIIHLPDRNKGTIKIKEEVPYTLIPQQVLVNRPASSDSIGSESQLKYNQDDWNSLPEVDIDLLLLKAFANLENYYNKKVYEIQARANSAGRPTTQREASELQNALSRLQKLQSTMKKMLKKQADTIMKISRNDDDMDGIKYYTSDGNPIYE